MAPLFRKRIPLAGRKPNKERLAYNRYLKAAKKVGYSGIFAEELAEVLTADPNYISNAGGTVKVAKMAKERSARAKSLLKRKK